MKTDWGKKLLALACAAAVAGVARAETNEALQGLTANDVLQLLIQEGVISKDKLKELAGKLRERQQQPGQQKPAAAVEQVGYEERNVPPKGDGSVVRVPYVPTFVRDAIRDEVRIGLKEDVTRDVLAQAKTERWGLPGVVPDWIDRIKISGDIRLRYQGDYFASDNVPFSYPNFNNISEDPALESSANFYNTTEDRQRLRTRLRLGVKAKVTNGIEAGARLVTGKRNDPVSTNQTIGSYDGKYETNFDLAYLSYTSADKSVFLTGGRIVNPFLSTDLVWDSDVSFEGVAGSWWFMRNDNAMDSEFRQFDPYVSLGAFPLQEIDESNHDKWLYAAQLGFNYKWFSQSTFSAALSYYTYQNIRGERNDLDGFDRNFTAPQFVQKGNSVFNILNPSSPSSTDALYALAADYDLANLTFVYDYAGFSPIHLIVTGDYVKNIGFDKREVQDRVGAKVDEQNQGWQLKVAVGWPVIAKRYDWQVALAYKYLERDAVLDAFTDSDFHLGGTDAQGYVLSFDYGLSNNTWTSLRWISTDEVEGNISGYHTKIGLGTETYPLGVDTLQLDINAKF